VYSNILQMTDWKTIYDKAKAHLEKNNASYSPDILEHAIKCSSLCCTMSKKEKYNQLTQHFDKKVVSVIINISELGATFPDFEHYVAAIKSA
jgi:hypothetical protein